MCKDADLREFSIEDALDNLCKTFIPLSLNSGSKITYPIFIKICRQRCYMLLFSVSFDYGSTVNFRLDLTYQLLLKHLIILGNTDLFVFFTIKGLGKTLQCITLIWTLLVCRLCKLQFYYSFSRRN